MRKNLLKAFLAISLMLMGTYAIATQAKYYILNGDIQEVGGEEQLGGPSLTYQKTILPEADSTYSLGSDSLAWLKATVDEFCLTGDECITEWGGAGGGGSSIWSTSTPGVYYYNGSRVIVVGNTATSSTNSNFEVTGGAWFDRATTTHFTINGETFTDLTGTGLTNVGGVLTAGGSMTYPDAGIAVSTGSAWDTSLAIGTDIQAWDAHLDSLAGLTPGAEGKIITSDGLGAYQISTAGEAKTYLSLNNVENTALSTWAGTSNITTLGTIGTGVWQGTAIGDTYISSASNWNTAYGWGDWSGEGFLVDPMTTRGDIIVRDASNDSERLAVGTAGQVLSTDGTDVSWQTIPNASAIANGILTMGDWSTFNGKLDSADIDTYVELNTIVADQTLAYGGGAFHDGFSDFVANEHIDWTLASQGTIHATNYVDNNTTYTGGGTLLDLTGTVFSLNEGTLTDTKLCTYESASGLVCNTTMIAYTGGTNLTLAGTTFNVDDAFLLNNGDTGTGVYDFGGATSLELPNNGTVNANGEITTDDTSGQLRYYAGSAQRVLSPAKQKCIVIEDLAAADDNMMFGSISDASTITNVWCQYSGTGTTVAQISLEDGSGNAMTHTTPTCTALGTTPTKQSVTAGNTLSAYESLAFDVDNAVSPETDTYTLCVDYTITAN